MCVRTRARASRRQGPGSDGRGKGSIRFRTARARTNRSRETSTPTSAGRTAPCAHLLSLGTRAVMHIPSFRVTSLQPCVSRIGAAPIARRGQRFASLLRAQVGHTTRPVFPCGVPCRIERGIPRFGFNEFRSPFHATDIWSVRVDVVRPPSDPSEPGQARGVDLDRGAERTQATVSHRIHTPRNIARPRHALRPRLYHLVCR